MSKLHLGVLCGGRSGEHEVSLQSAHGIYRALDRSRFAPVLIAVDKQGDWHAGSAEDLLRDATDPARIHLDPAAPQVFPLRRDGRCVLIPAATLAAGAAPDAAGAEVLGLDAVLPIIHGTDGEDGALQGLLRLLDVPFVGADVAGSAVGMDKDLMKRLLTLADLPVAPYRVLHAGQQAAGGFAAMAAALGQPLFVKPAALGSSVGVSRVEDAAGYDAAVAEAFTYGDKVIVEQAVPGREVEGSVLGSRYSERYPPAASRVGEIRPRHAFYSYAAKYLDDAGAELLIPAELPPGVEAQVQALALRVFEALECEGLARVDCFVRDSGGVVVNEINTLPGFTPISMYPKLWEASGLPYAELLTRLVELALERHARQRAHKRDFDLP